MVHLLDLPDELFELILTFLITDPSSTNPNPKSFETWTEEATKTTARHLTRTHNLHSLSLTCHSCARLANSFLYHHVIVSTSSPLSLFTRTITDTSTCVAPIVNTTSITASASGGTREFKGIFWLPSITLVELIRFNDSEPLEFEAGVKATTQSPSAVTTLRLLHCSAHEEALTTVLSWPKALEELWYEADHIWYDAGHIQWSSMQEREDNLEWTCQAIVRALGPQRRSLRLLVLTRTAQDPEVLLFSPRIDLSEFTALRELRIFHMFLVAYGEPEGVDLLPPKLEELQVYYDDYNLASFLETRPTWLLDILARKKELLPELKKIRILLPVSPGNIWNGLQMPRLMEKFRNIGVELCVTLGYFDT